MSPWRLEYKRLPYNRVVPTPEHSLTDRRVQCSGSGLQTTLTVLVAEAITMLA